MAAADYAAMKLPLFLRLPLEYTIDTAGKLLVKRDPAEYSGKHGSLMLGGAAVAGAELKFHRGKNLHYAELLPQGITFDEAKLSESTAVLELVFARTADSGDIPVDEYNGYSFDIEPLFRWMSAGDARGVEDEKLSSWPGEEPAVNADDMPRDANVVLSMNGMVVARGEAVLLGDRYGIRVTGEPDDAERFMLMDGHDGRGTIILGARALPLGELPAFEPGSLVFMDTGIGEPFTARLDSGVRYHGEIIHRGNWKFRVFHSREDMLRARMHQQMRSAAGIGAAAANPAVEIHFGPASAGGPSAEAAPENPVNAEREYRLNAILADLLAEDEAELRSPDHESEDLSIFRKNTTIVIRNATASALAAIERLKDLETYRVRLDNANDDLIFQVAGLFPWIQRLKIAGRPLSGTISPLDLSPLAYLKDLRELALADLNLYNLSFMAEMQAVESFRMERCTGTGPESAIDLSPLSGCGSLKRVAFALTRVRGHGDALRNKDLEEALFWKSGITDIDFMRGMVNCWKLVLGDEPIEGVSVLSGLEKLEELRMAFCDRIVDTSGFDGLRDLPVLKILHLECCGISDISFMSAMKRVEYLHLGGNPDIDDISPLAGCGRIYELYLQNTSAADTAVLSGLDHLEVLNLACTPCADFSSLAGLHWLKRLDLTYTPFADIALLKGLRELEELRLYWNNVGDTSPLLALPALRRLHMGLCGLAAVPEALCRMKDLEYLNIAGNDIPGEDLAALADALPGCEIETGYTLTDEYHAYDSNFTDDETAPREPAAPESPEYEPQGGPPPPEPDFVTWMIEKPYLDFLDGVARAPFPQCDVRAASRDNLAAFGLLVRRACKTVAAGFSTDAELLAGREPASVSLDIVKLRVTRFARARDALAADTALIVVQPRPLSGYAFIALEPGCIAALAGHVTGDSPAASGGGMDGDAIRGSEDKFIMLPSWLHEAWGDILPLRPRFCLVPGREVVDGAPGDAATVEIEIAASLGGTPGTARVLVPLGVIAPVVPLLDADYLDGTRDMPDEMRALFAGGGDDSGAGSREPAPAEEAVDIGPLPSAVPGGPPHHAKDLTGEEIDALLAGADDLVNGASSPARAGTATPPSLSEIDSLLGEADRPLSSASPSEPTEAPPPLSTDMIDGLLGTGPEVDEAPARGHIPIRLGDRLDGFSQRAACSGKELGECLAYAEYLVGQAIASKRLGHIGTGDMIESEIARHPLVLRMGFRMLLDGTDPEIVDRFLEMSIFANGFRGAKLLAVLLGIAFMRHVPCDTVSLVALVETIAGLAGEEHRERFEGMVPRADMLLARYIVDNPREGPSTISDICAEIEGMIETFDSRSLGKLVSGLLDADPELIVNAIRYFGSRAARWTIESVDDEGRRLKLATALMKKGPSVQQCIEAQESLAAYIRGNPDFAWMVGPTKETPL